MTKSPAISVVIATRDRPAQLARLLHCVKDQDFSNFECIVVDDASSDQTLHLYEELWRELDARFILLRQESGAKGPSFSRNKGIRAALAPFVAFCDDDDMWTRRDHLSCALDALIAHGADFFFANMRTSRNGEVLGADFYGRIRHILTRTILSDGVFEVAPKERAAAMQHIFIHCNSMVVSRHLLHSAGLYWEKLFMAEDRDFALRLLDRAKRVVYRDEVVADYDRTAIAGLCKSYTEDEIRSFVILAMLHAETQMNDTQLLAVARGYRAWMLYELAQSARQEGRQAEARELALQSVLLRPTLAALKQLLSLRLYRAPRLAEGRAR
ncbi:glycosyltransferase involved in cell wall biosynthesis [Rhizomicrobium palustre]|uniref:Glycosyltransferase involved in cell wall biosynthesis n=1 Tax=Rhizomicrobium palustre TaxID=189966 RepID=A0A846MUD2_9PROT|nr:glycosyltransferase family A protein [Rhizomicrobium palustre]NIK86722.1 glycosyltransferase involved in cell wall biosynthesis [Rhizomicrobium palustre]